MNDHVRTLVYTLLLITVPFYTAAQTPREKLKECIEQRKLTTLQAYLKAKEPEYTLADISRALLIAQEEKALLTICQKACDKKSKFQSFADIVTTPLKYFFDRPTTAPETVYLDLSILNRMIQILKQAAHRALAAQAVAVGEVLAGKAQTSERDRATLQQEKEGLSKLAQHGITLAEIKQRKDRIRALKAEKSSLTTSHWLLLRKLESQYDELKTARQQQAQLEEKLQALQSLYDSKHTDLQAVSSAGVSLHEELKRQTKQLHDMLAEKKKRAQKDSGSNAPASLPEDPSQTIHELEEQVAEQEKTITTISKIIFDLEYNIQRIFGAAPTANDLNLSECPICFEVGHKLIQTSCCQQRICEPCLVNWYSKCPDKRCLCPFCRKNM